MLHGESALAWFGLPGFDLARIHIVRRRETTRALPRVAVLHRLRDLTTVDTVVVGGVATVTPLRAIWSEASRFSPPRLHSYGLKIIGRLLDAAHRAGLVTWDELHRSVRRLGRRGRAGTRLMRALAAERLPGSSPTESRNEDRFEEIVGDRLGHFRRQRLVGGTRPIGRVDFRERDVPLVVEVNSVTFHSTPSDRAADERRYCDLSQSGFTVAVVWEGDLWGAVGEVRRLIARARRDAIDRRGSVLHSPSCPWPDAGPGRSEPRRPRSRG